MVENLPLNHHGVEPSASPNEDGVGNVWKNTNSKFTKKESRCACDLRDHTDSTPYASILVLPQFISNNTCRQLKYQKYELVFSVLVNFSEMILKDMGRWAI